MHETDRPRLAMCLNAAAALWRVEVTQPLVHGYWIGLRSLPIAQVERAFAAAMQRCRFLPTPAELRELVAGPKAEDRAVKAWACFERAVVVHGGYASVVFSDPVLNATIRSLGGWQRCCALPVDEFDKWLRQDFLKSYAALCRTGVGPEAALPHGGIHESRNLLHGHTSRVRAPLLIEVDLPAVPGTPSIAGRAAGNMAQLGAERGRMPAKEPA